MAPRYSDKRSKGFMPPLYPQKDVDFPATIRPLPAPAPPASHTTTMIAASVRRCDVSPPPRKSRWLYSATNRGSPARAGVRSRLVPVGIHRHQFVAAVGPADIVEAGHGELNVLRLGGLFQRKRTLALGVQHVHRRALFLGSRSSANEPTRTLGGPGSSRAQVPRGLLDERHERGVHAENRWRYCRKWRRRSARGLAHLLIEQQRRLVASAGRHARIARVTRIAW